MSTVNKSQLEEQKKKFINIKLSFENEMDQFEEKADNELDADRKKILINNKLQQENYMDKMEEIVDQTEELIQILDKMNQSGFDKNAAKQQLEDMKKDTNKVIGLFLNELNTIATKEKIEAVKSTHEQTLKKIKRDLDDTSNNPTWKTTYGKLDTALTQAGITAASGGGSADSFFQSLFGSWWSSD